MKHSNMLPRALTTNDVRDLANGERNTLQIFGPLAIWLNRGKLEGKLLDKENARWTLIEATVIFSRKNHWEMKDEEIPASLLNGWHFEKNRLKRSETAACMKVLETNATYREAPDWAKAGMLGGAVKGVREFVDSLHCKIIAGTPALPEVLFAMSGAIVIGMAAFMAIAGNIPLDALLNSFFDQPLRVKLAIGGWLAAEAFFVAKLAAKSAKGKFEAVKIGKKMEKIIDAAVQKEWAGSSASLREWQR